MSPARRNVVLLGMLLVLGALDVLTRPRHETAAARGTVLADVDLSRTERIRVTLAGHEPLELRRRGTAWTVPALRDFPATDFAVRDLLQRLSAVSRADLVAREEATARELVAGEGERRIELVDGDGGLLAAVDQLLPRTEASGSFVRRAGSRELQRAASLAPVPVEPMAWVDARVLALDPARVRVLSITDAGGAPLRLERAEDGTWTSAGRGVRRGTAQRLVGAACGLAFRSVEPAPADAAHGLDPPQGELRLETDGGDVFVLRLGGRDVAGGRYLTRSDWAAGWVVVVPAALAAALEQALAAVRDEL